MANGWNGWLVLLDENVGEIRKNAIHVLWEICDNILKYPEEPKYRRLRSDNPVIEKLLAVEGGLGCLYEIGYIKDKKTGLFNLQEKASLSHIKAFQEQLTEMKRRRIKGLLPAPSPVKYTGTVSKPVPKQYFLQRIAHMFQEVLNYEDPDLQEMTRLVVPITDLKLRALERMRTLQKELKNGNFKNGVAGRGIEQDLAIEEIMLGELLSWFKNEFFTWFDTMTCTSCASPCVFDRNEYVNDPRISRLEIYKCKVCNKEEEFPRYTHPKVLLATRKGRCGEWGNCFALICRALSYDVRLVHDETDHVWVEVWSIASNRWIHADPCENALDQPLMYEKGWKKKLSYIIAYSRDEVQDVTWRYTRDEAAVIDRRNLCSEEDLAAHMWRLNLERYNSPGYSEIRKKFVIHRRLLELADFLAKTGQFDEDENKYGGRISGDLAWRMARNEVPEDKRRLHIWKIPEGVKTYFLKFCLVKDSYEILDEAGRVLERVKGWREGVKSATGIIRNVEHDWKMVYLCRAPSASVAVVMWSFDLSNHSNLNLFEMSATTSTFENGKIKWQLEGFVNGPYPIKLPVDDAGDFITKKLNGARMINITAELSGGTGEVAWQHAQLFRHKLSAVDECSISIAMSFGPMTE